MNKQLPERPDFGQLKKQAKELLDEVHRGAPEAHARLTDEGSKISAGAEATERFALHDAQRVIAREYGFASWAKLKLHLETRTAETAETRLIETALAGERDAVEAIVAERPRLTSDSLWAAAAFGRRDEICARLEKDATLAKTRGGPRCWEPLLYVCFGRCGAGDAERAEAARALIASGADVNASWIHEDWPESPLPALYGATGVNDYPQLARVLLAAGANPNDGESRYHATEHNHRASLEVLAEFGADFSGADKTWGNTPLYFLFGHTHPTPTVKAGVQWLLEHGANPNALSHAGTLAETALHAAVKNDWDAETIELLLKHGADPALRRADGRTAYALAIAGGRDEIAEALRARGAATEVSLVDIFLGACMRGDPAQARGFVRETPDLVAQLPLDDRQIVSIAARFGRAGALALMGELGFDLEIHGPDGERPLHWAAWHGWVESVGVLIAQGVELNACDRRFCAPPVGWCAHGSEFSGNTAGEHGKVMELLIAAGASVPANTDGSPEIMAVLRKHGLTGKSRG